MSELQYVLDTHSRHAVIVLGDLASGIHTKVPEALLGQSQPQSQPKSQKILIVSPYHVKSRAREFNAHYELPFDHRAGSQNARVIIMSPEMFIHKACSEPKGLDQYFAIVLEDFQPCPYSDPSMELVLGLASSKLAKENSATGNNNAFVLVIQVLKDQDGLIVQKVKAYLGSLLGTDSDSSANSLVPVSVISLESSDLNSVDTLYLTDSTSDYLVKALDTTKDICKNYPAADEGDILVFVTDNSEIAYLRSFLEAPEHKQPNTVIVPLFDDYHGQVEYSEETVDILQHQFSFNVDTRLVILAGPNHETDDTLLNLKSIRFVLDIGYTRLGVVDTAVDSKVAVTKTSADLRLQFATRHRLNGVCARLYTQEAAVSLLADLSESSSDTSLVPQINISGLLQLCCRPDLSLLSFPYYTSPSPFALTEALSTLHWLGAVDLNGTVTPLGKLMASLPVSKVPLGVSRILGLAIYDSHSHQSITSELLIKTILRLIAAVSVGGLPSILVLPGGLRGKDTASAAHRQFQVSQGDYLTLINIMDQFLAIKPNSRKSWCAKNFLIFKVLQQAADVYDQLQRQNYVQNTVKSSVKKPASKNDRNAYSYHSDALVELVCKGLFIQLAKYDDRSGQFIVVATNKRIEAHESSVYAKLSPIEMRKITKSPWFVYESSAGLTLKGLTNVDRSTIDEMSYYEKEQDHF